jgi:hypothetical protein
MSMRSEIKQQRLERSPQSVGIKALKGKWDSAQNISTNDNLYQTNKTIGLVC